MKRYITTFVLACFLFCTQVTAEELHKYNALIEHSRDAVVVVAAEVEEGRGGYGTGFLISADGYLITNYHVVHRSTIIRVWFYDEEDPKHYKADMVAFDPVADLALLKLNVREDMLPLTHLKIEGNLDRIQVGDEVIAIGHLLGLHWTVTRGHISHADRRARHSVYVKTIQHTAPINRGNSGGPLINTEGHVIGVNTWVLIPKGQTVGVGYAVRGDVLYKSVKALMKDGERVRPSMGIMFSHLSEFSIKRLTKENPGVFFPNTFGIVASGVKEDSWAYKQGIRSHDVVVAVDGNPVNGLSDLVDYVMHLPVGQAVSLLVIREGVFTKVDYELKKLEFDLAYYDKRLEQEENTEETPEPEPEPEDE